MFGTVSTLVGGTGLFLPMTNQLAWLAEKLIPEHHPSLTRNLDPSMRAVPSLAVDAARGALRQCAIITLQNAASRLRGEDSPLPLAYLQEVQQANQEVASFLARLPSVEGSVLARLNAVLHALDHVNQCAGEAASADLADVRRRVPELSGRTQQLADLLLRAAQALTDDEAAHTDEVAAQLVEAIQSSADARPAILQSTLHHRLNMDDALYGLSAQRRFDRLTHHAARALHYLNQLDETTEPRPSVAELDQRPDTD